jgi:hypothetical protein
MTSSMMSEPSARAVVSGPSARSASSGVSPRSSVKWKRIVRWPAGRCSSPRAIASATSSISFGPGSRNPWASSARRARTSLNGSPLSGRLRRHPWSSVTSSRMLPTFRSRWLGDMPFYTRQVIIRATSRRSDTSVRAMSVHGRCPPSPVTKRATCHERSTIPGPFYVYGPCCPWMRTTAMDDPSGSRHGDSKARRKRPRHRGHDGPSSRTTTA